MPQMLLIKIRGCSRQLVDGYPPGVIGLMPYKGSVEIQTPMIYKSKNPTPESKSNTRKTWNPTLKQFPVIGALSLTPEKLQGTII
jgi:hypothetical protein